MVVVRSAPAQVSLQLSELSESAACETIQRTFVPQEKALLLLSFLLLQGIRHCHSQWSFCP